MVIAVKGQSYQFRHYLSGSFMLPPGDFLGGRQNVAIQIQCGSHGYTSVLLYASVAASTSNIKHQTSNIIYG
jgi:hypothetical protein